jgi:beta-N-acetylhexosaminidase
LSGTPEIVSRGAFISGCKAGELTCDEFDFFRTTSPVGLILFRRNCKNPEQVRRLAERFAESLCGAPHLVLVDQEGGRVQRLQPPGWRKLPPATAYATMYRKQPEKAVRGAFLVSRLLADELILSGINVNCAPVLDIPAAGSHSIIGDRAYGRTVEEVTEIGTAVARGLISGGVLPVIKHLPGHGRARTDSHAELPVITSEVRELLARDFRPFIAARDMPLGMTGHLLFPALDGEFSVSQSEIIIRRIIRKQIGFDGLLMSDDLSMRSLSGSMSDRARRVISAGCDVALHCNGNMAEMQEVAKAAGTLTDMASKRFAIAIKACTRGLRPDYDEDAARMLLNEVMELA